MSFQLHADQGIQKNIRRIARQQIDKAINEIDDTELDRHEAIHQVRKRCKKLRGLIRLVQPVLGSSYQRENAGFKEIADALAVLRDEQSLVEVLEDLLASLKPSERKQFNPVLQNLCERRDAAASRSGQNPDVLLAETRKQLKTIRKRVARWRLDTEGYPAVRGGFKLTYKRGRKTMKQAYKSEQASDFHEWRKRVKYHMHHLKLLDLLWPDVTKVWRKQTKALADILGQDHDLALLRELLSVEGKSLADDALRQQLSAVIAKEQQRLRAQAWSIGQRFHAEKPKALNKRWKRYWQVWQSAGT